MANLFFDIGIVIILATLFAYAARCFRQPLILAYMIAGIVIGPMGLKLITNYENISVLSEIGIAFLLFIVGLELDIKKLKTFGLTAITMGAGQIVFTFAIAYPIALAFGYSNIVSFYIAAALTFSSTVIVVKLYSDKKEMGSLHGRIALGILLVQDFVAVILLVLLSGINGIAFASVSFTMFKGISLLAAAFLAGQFLLGHVFKPIAKSSELLFLAAVAWCFLFALAAKQLEFSIAIGAFLAGVSLASLPYNLEIISRVRPLRDFFATMFFVSLGMLVVFAQIRGMIIPIIIFSIFVLIGSPFIVMALMGLLGYKARTSFLVSVAIAQISEFSLIVVVLGYQLGHLSQEIISLIAIIAVITITASSYMITYDNWLYEKLKPFAKLFERKKTKQLEFIPSMKYDAVLCGCHRMGGTILKTLAHLKKHALVVDFNPETIRKLMGAKQPCIYGDVGDLEIIQRLPLTQAQFLVSTVPDKEANILLIGRAKGMNKNILVFVTADSRDEALELYNIGADYVILPHHISGAYVSLILQDVHTNLKNILKHKARHLKYLKSR